MKRDIDLCRQLLFDLEARGPECAIHLLRGGLANEAEDRLRFHLRLLSDAGLVKEINQSTGGMACVRLTNSGIELIELCRSDARWRDAKAMVLDRTGGLSLTVIRTLLTKWAVDAASHAHRPRSGYLPYYRRGDSLLRYDSYRTDRNLAEHDDELRLVRTAPDYRERWHDTHYYHGHHVETDAVEPEVGVQLPIYLV